MNAALPFEIEELARSLKLMANPNRLRILLRLLEGEASVGSIEEELEIRQPGLSRELANLRDAGAIEARRESKVVFYSLGSGPVRSLLLCLVGADKPKAIKPVSSAQPDFNPRPKFRFYTNPNDRLLKRQGDQS
jgi:DNA-binding transcriptional ArsR family regulator